MELDNMNNKVIIKDWLHFQYLLNEFASSFVLFILLIIIGK